jgi:uncharacterized damage-inducible protein DinB
VDLPSPTDHFDARSELFVSYLDFFRQRIIDKSAAMPTTSLSRSMLPTGWTPLELMKHLRFVELRWLEWGFEGISVENPWGDRDADKWHTAPTDTLAHLAAALATQGVRTSEIIARHDLDERGAPSERWNGEEPPTLERVLFHLLQEYARHVGHLDIVAELAIGEGDKE